MINKKKILIADDDRDFVDILKLRLESEGYKVFSVYEGVRAVEAAHKEKPDLIILDWKMPSGKGSAVLNFLSQKDDTKNIPVIVVTAWNEPSVREKSNTYGVKAIIYKPYDIMDLLNKIKDVLG